jgi:hypothetical protein
LAPMPHRGSLILQHKSQRFYASWPKSAAMM